MTEGSHTMTTVPEGWELKRVSELYHLTTSQHEEWEVMLFDDRTGLFSWPSWIDMRYSPVLLVARRKPDPAREKAIEVIREWGSPRWGMTSQEIAESLLATLESAGLRVVKADR